MFSRTSRLVFSLSQVFTWYQALCCSVRPWPHMIESPNTSRLSWRSAGFSVVNGGGLWPEIAADRMRTIATTATSGRFMKCEKDFMRDSPPILAHAPLRVTSNYWRVMSWFRFVFMRITKERSTKPHQVTRTQPLRVASWIVFRWQADFLKTRKLRHTVRKGESPGQLMRPVVVSEENLPAG